MSRFEDALGRMAAAMVEAAHRAPRATVALSLLVACASGWAAARWLEVDTDSDRLLASHLPVRQTNLALAEAFPALRDNLVVMIEADDVDDARDAAIALRDRLAAEPERYRELFLPGYGDYYDDFGLYHLEREDLDDLAGRIDNAGELLATLAERTELPVLFGALAHVVGSVEGVDSLGEEGKRILDELTVAFRDFGAGGRAGIDWDDLLFEDVDAGFTNPQLLFVKPVGDLTRIEPVLDAIGRIRAMGADLEPHPGLRVRVTGDRAAHSEEMSLIITEVSVSGAASLLLVTFVLLYCLRSLRLVAATVLTLVVGLAWTAGFAAVVVGQLNALTSAFAVLYIGLGVDFGIHFALGYLDARDRGAPVGAALIGTGSSVGRSLFLCAVTTATGFYAFIPTEYGAVADIGIISGSGVFLGLVASLTLYPALITLGLGEANGGVQETLARLQLGLPRFPTRYPRSVCAVSALVAVACGVAALGVRFDFSTLKVRDPRVESVAALADLLTDPELSVWTIDVIARDVAEAEAIAAALAPLEGVEQVHTPKGFLPDEQEERLAIFGRMREQLTTPVELTDEERAEGFDRLDAVEVTIEGYAVALDIDAELAEAFGDVSPIRESAWALREELDRFLDRLRAGEIDEADLERLEGGLFGDLAEVLDDVIEALPSRLVALEDLPADLLARYVAEDGRARVEVFSEANLNDRGELERFYDAIHAVRVDAGGPAAGTVALGRAIVSSLQQALATAVAVIALLLLVLWRSVRYAAMALAALATGALATAAVSVVADIPFNFANVIVLPLLLGIGIDSGIHLVNRHRAGLGDAGDLLDTATARGVLFSALTTVVSFATLAFSNHLGIASLAKMLCAGVLLMLAANVIVLPAILAWADGAGGGGEGEGG